MKIRFCQPLEVLDKIQPLSDLRSDVFDKTLLILVTPLHLHETPVTLPKNLSKTSDTTFLWISTPLY